MFKLPFLNKTQKSDRFLTIHISTSEVKCLAIYCENGIFKIIGHGIAELEPGNVRGGIIIDKEKVATALQDTIEKATEHSEETISDVIFGVGSNLCTSLMTTIRSKRAARTPIEENELEDLYSKVNETAFIQAQNEFLEITGDSETELVSITSSNVYLKSEGQKVDSLIGKPAGVIEIAVFNSYAPNYHVKALQQLAKKCELDILAIGSELYSLVQNIIQTNRETLDFVILDIGTDYTNAAVVFSGGVVSNKSLNIGYSHFVDALNDRMGITVEESRKILRTYLAGGLSQSEGFVVLEALRDVIEVWLLGLEMLFREFYGVKTFPSKIFITGAGADIKEILDSIKTEPWTKTVPFKSPPVFSKLSFSDLRDIVDSTSRVNKSEWVSAASLAVIYNEIGNQND